FRFSMTKVPSNRVAVAQPPVYRREDFAGILPLFASGKLKHAYAYPRDCVFKAQVPMCPNGKYDINDVSGGPVRLSLPGENLTWPDGDAAARRRVFDEHLRWEVGLLYFLQNDDAVPAKIRDDAREY